MKHFLFACDQITKVGPKAVVDRQATLLEIADYFVKGHETPQNCPPAYRHSLMFDGELEHNGYLDVTNPSAATGTVVVQAEAENAFLCNPVVGFTEPKFGTFPSFAKK
jgi:hypothetical protein